MVITSFVDYNSPSTQRRSSGLNDTEEDHDWRAWGKCPEQVGQAL